MARPSDYTEELAKEICDLIADGWSLRKINKIKGMPERRTIMRWETEREEFRDQIARARNAKYENDVEELEEINEDVRKGVLDPQRAAVMSNNIKWVAGKLLPKRYGDSTQIRHADADGNKMDLRGVLAAIDGKTANLKGNQNDE